MPQDGGSDVICQCHVSWAHWDLLQPGSERLDWLDHVGAGSAHWQKVGKEVQQDCNGGSND
jgi:hypothetical protein